MSAFIFLLLIALAASATVSLVEFDRWLDRRQRHYEDVAWHTLVHTVEEGRADFGWRGNLRVFKEGQRR